MGERVLEREATLQRAFVFFPGLDQGIVFASEGDGWPIIVCTGAWLDSTAS